MPELPEVETTRRGLAPHLIGQNIQHLVIRQPRLRWPVPRGLAKTLAGLHISDVRRRAKYLLIDAGKGTLIIHLGMSGSLRILPCGTPYKKHDHIEWVLTNGLCLRLHDPRRFGAVLWTTDKPERHARLINLGPEPLGADLTGDYLFKRSRKRTINIRDFLLNSKIIAGVGNIYANEALFLAGIRPTRPAGRLSQGALDGLVAALQQTLGKAIEAGGTTLRDFSDADGNPGYFQQTLNVYQRSGQPCRVCGTPIKGQRLGQRSAFYCPHCQT